MSSEPQLVWARGHSPLPKITIQFCTQCKWMLRATYYAQELLSTFSTSLGEVALQPSTGGTFVITIHHPVPAPSAEEQTGAQPSTEGAGTGLKVLWNRKSDGGFPETKELKRRVRDVIEPGRDLGHVDRDHKKEKAEVDKDSKGTGDEGKKEGEHCEDCGP